MKEVSELEQRVRERACTQLRERITTQVANVRNAFPGTAGELAKIRLNGIGVRATLADDRDGGTRPVSALHITSLTAAQILVDALVVEGAEAAEDAAIRHLLAVAEREEVRRG